LGVQLVLKAPQPLDAGRQRCLGRIAGDAVRQIAGIVIGKRETARRGAIRTKIDVQSETWCILAHLRRRMIR
jgi:hypothetical protein